jgi:hypothetical protein
MEVERMGKPRIRWHYRIVEYQSLPQDPVQYQVARVREDLLTGERQIRPVYEQYPWFHAGKDMRYTVYRTLTEAVAAVDELTVIEEARHG